MKLILYRTKFYETATIGRLYLDEHFICWTLEDKTRDICTDATLEEIAEVKIPKHTAIPYGTYEIQMTYSNRFKKVMPLLIDVPGFTGIRIHSANKASELEGCIAPGLVNSGESVLNSRIATASVYQIINEGLKHGKFYITITKKDV